mmetsp:Transcript_108310/g.305352  ORF Transcript_108310/g.305352 Transcript_108310/m.305352 type:complete len:332 (-) Transcript_108310:94-1089(-)|eukprot:CAMPEP_0117490882 /NCGR_PEP_ID=MMETSP0784-20121206/17776_1 /TAXON_ID=39447 /ORGANISM="" /LENGTH=331 /DNA_ID=CAMNT_0005285647 /DNA_START=58 /DNA_END=1053 /DNA_ORIENTATION=+
MPKTLRCDPKLFNKDLSGKVIIITGCTSGTGLCTAKQLLKQKATVIMASRNVQVGESTAKEAGGIFMQLDLASLDSVRAFCDAFKAKYDRLDVLVNNAGVMLPPLSHTKDGFELQMGTNHFGHFLLTELLKDVLEKSAPSRVVNLASCAAAPCSPDMGQACEIKFDDLHWKSRKYNKGEAYAQSKLANVLHASEIAKRYKGVSAYSVHPGWVQSKLMRHVVPGCCSCCVECCCMNCTGSMINVHDGSQTSLHCILSEPEALENGAFYSQFGIYKDKASRSGGWPMQLPNPNANDGNAARLWEESVKLVGLGPAGHAPSEAMVVKAPEQNGM